MRKVVQAKKAEGKKNFSLLPGNREIDTYIN
jgi:hypothetical protein